MKVGVVILNYKVQAQTVRCVESVLKSDYKDLQVYVVDNSSGDSIEESIKKYPEVIFIQTGSNLGYTGGNNIGIQRSLDDGVDAVFILNPDTQIEKDSISELVKASKDNPKAGILGSKILFSNKKTIWYAGGILDLANVLGGHRGVDEQDKGQYQTIGPTDYVTGGAMFVKSQVFKKIGLFDQRYFLYYEDSDFCYRAKQAGFMLIYVPKSVIYHANAQSTGLGSPLQDYFITRNRLLFARKYLPLRTQLALIREVLMTLKYHTRRLALLDFLIGNFGKGSFLK